ncbi:MAG: LysR family transcriptional regulator [Thiohalophilus sp.]
MDKPSPPELVRRASLRQLQIFDAVAQTGSYTRAAEQLYLTQPTVSIQIHKLEESVGLTLFDHVGRRLYLTEAGKTLHGATREVLDAFARVEMELADLKGMKTGHLRLAVVTTAKYFAPRALGVFCQRYPGIDVALKVTNRERLLERMNNNVDDLYIMGHPPDSEQFLFRPFLPNPIVILAPAGHPLANESQIPLTHFVEEPLIMREEGSGTRMAVEALFAKHGLKPRVRMELGSNEAIKQAIIGGLGLSALSRHTITGEDIPGSLVILNVEGFPIEWNWYIGYPKGKQPSVVVWAFLNFLELEADKLLTWR